MAQTQALFITVAFLLAVTIPGAYLEPIGCYLCNSYTDIDPAACLDPMTPFPAVNTTVCDESYVCTRVSYMTQKTLVVSRGCDQPVNTCENIYYALSAYYPDISSFNCYTCKANWCNDALGSNVNGNVTDTLKLTPPKVLNV